MAMEIETDMNSLPEGCVANTLSLTSPREACRLSLVNSLFRSASQSDDVWERFFPSDYHDIIGRSNVDLDAIRYFSSKKELYLYLCDNNFLIDDGKKSFWLDKRSGKKCYMLAARDLSIVWGDTPAYWGWNTHSESRFPEVAELLDVCWLEISGKIRTDILSPNTSYVAYLVYTTKADLRGFDHQLAEGSFGISGEESKPVSICLDPIAARALKYQTQPRRRFWRFNPQQALMGRHQQQTLNLDSKALCPVPRDDHWMEVELGEFFVQGTEDVELEMSLKEIKAGNWKSGLFIEGIEIRPKRIK